MDSREDWSLRTEEGVLVIKGDTIVERAKSEDLDQLLQKYEKINIERNPNTQNQLQIW